MTTLDSSPTVIDSGNTPAGNTPSDSTPVSPDTPAPANSDVSTAPSSGAKEGESKESLLSAVMKVVKTDPDADKVKLSDKEATPASDQPQSDTADEQSNQQEELPDDPTPEELGKYSHKSRKRVNQLLEQRRELREELQSLRGEAEVARSIQGYLQKNDIQREDFGVLLELGAALRRGDWQTFYAGVKPYMQVAEEALGVRLPPDLAQRVQQGHMTTETARHYSQERYARQLAEANAQRATSQIQHTEHQQQVEAVQHSVKSAVENWEAQVRQQDPDYGIKQDAIKNIMWAVIREQGAPTSPEHAVAIANESYRRANDIASRMAPKPRATSAVPSSIHRSTGAVAEPKSMMEAALLGLSRTRRTA